MQPVRGRQREQKFQKTSWKLKFLRDAAAILFPVLLDHFVVFTSCMIHLEVSRPKTAKHKSLPGREFFG